MREKTKKIAYLGLFTAVSLILSYVETLVPPLFPVPGIKMGLANIMVLLVLYEYSLKEAALCSFVRIIISSLLFGTMMTFLYSLAGGALSLLVMWLIKKIKISTSVAVSVSGGVMHNVGQIMVAMILLQTKEIIFYLPPLLLSGTITGIFVGVVAALIMKAISKRKRVE